MPHAGLILQKLLVAATSPEDIHLSSNLNPVESVLLPTSSLDMNRVRSAGLDGHYSQGYHANDLDELDEYYLRHPPAGYHLAEIVTLPVRAAPRHDTARKSRSRAPSPPRCRRRSLSNASSESRSRERPRSSVPASHSPSPTSSMRANTLSRTPSPLPRNPFDYQVYTHNNGPRHNHPARADRPAVASGPQAAEGAETFVDVREVRESNVDGDVERVIEIAETVRAPEGKEGLRGPKAPEGSWREI
ncbi:hypothetical protein B0A49_04529 [Cryomyces minteri]|uniref:Uncharacterized protein n=1 Tax=Cryomyces minteri TaxID=331657 RepID=A0A4U0XKR0_9PEZI|nr:hypothetical protein B0A49_04529 [Cryomyces minteri]